MFAPMKQPPESPPVFAHMPGSQRVLLRDHLDAVTGAVLSVVLMGLAWWVSGTHVASGTDPVSYVGGADSIARGHGFQTWLENPVVTFPPAWSWFIALFARLGIPLNLAAMFAIFACVMAMVACLVGLLRRCVTSPGARTAALIAICVSPVISPWAFNAGSEVPFTAITLVTLWLACRWSEHKMPLGVVIIAASMAPIVRWAGIAVPIAVCLWILGNHRTVRGLVTSAVTGALSLVPLLAVAVYNQANSTDAFGSRPPSQVGPLGASQMGIASLGRVVFWTRDTVGDSLALLAGVVFVGAGIAVISGSRLPGHVDQGAVPGGQFSARLLVAICAIVQMCVLIGARAVSSIDLDGRMVAPVSVFFLIGIAALLDDLDNTLPKFTRLVLRAGAAVWIIIGIAALGRGVIRNHDSNGFYGPAYATQFASPALVQIPQRCRTVTIDEIQDDSFRGCATLANDPWSWYPSSFRPITTPRKAYGDINDSARLTAALRRGAQVYLVWSTINEPFGYLRPLSELQADFELVPLGTSEKLAVYEVRLRS